MRPARRQGLLAAMHPDRTRTTALWLAAAVLALVLAPTVADAVTLVVRPGASPPPARTSTTHR
jgi:hypothetical protein